ncbi:MAG: hypothetical protein ABIL69_10310 [candidate division WOR-3 bacterium]
MFNDPVFTITSPTNNFGQFFLISSGEVEKLFYMLSLNRRLSDKTKRIY